MTSLSEAMERMLAIAVSGPEEKRRRAGLRNVNRYVFALVDGVFDAATLQHLRDAYPVAERRQRELGNRTLEDGSYVSRNGRFDVALTAPRDDLSAFVLSVMKRERDTRLQTGVRALVVPDGGAPAQPFHQDLDTVGSEPRYVTLLVALEDMPVDGDGATEFRAPWPPAADGLLRGRDGFNPDTHVDTVRPRLLANQGLLFDGRIFHRGGAAVRRRPPVVYMVYTERAIEENV